MELLCYESYWQALQRAGTIDMTPLWAIYWYLNGVDFSIYRLFSYLLLPVNTIHTKQRGKWNKNIENPLTKKTNKLIIVWCWWCVARKHCYILFSNWIESVCINSQFSVFTTPFLDNNTYVSSKCFASSKSKSLFLIFASKMIRAFVFPSFFDLNCLQTRKELSVSEGFSSTTLPQYQVAFTGTAHEDISAWAPTSNCCGCCCLTDAVHVENVNTKLRQTMH